MYYLAGNLNIFDEVQTQSRFHHIIEFAKLTEPQLKLNSVDTKFNIKPFEVAVICVQYLKFRKVRKKAGAVVQ